MKNRAWVLVLFKAIGLTLIWNVLVGSTQPLTLPLFYAFIAFTGFGQPDPTKGSFSMENLYILYTFYFILSIIVPSILSLRWKIFRLVVFTNLLIFFAIAAYSFVSVYILPTR